MKSDGINRLYRHVYTLVKHGFSASILHRQEGFNLKGQPQVPIKYLQTPYVLNPGDIVVIPEAYYAIMEELKDIPIRKFVISLSWTYIFGLPVFIDWRKLNIERAIVVSPFIGKLISWSMNIPVHLLDSGIDHNLYYYKPELKKVQISYIDRKAKSIVPFKRILEARNPDFINKIKWAALKDLSENEYASEIRHSSVFLNLSTEEGLLTGCLKAMSAGAIVAGFNSIGGQDIMTGNGQNQNCILAQNGDYINLAYAIEPLLIDLINNNFEKNEKWSNIIKNAVSLSSQYSPEIEEKSIIHFWGNIIKQNNSDKNIFMNSKKSLKEKLNIGISLHKSGELEKALNIYNDILLQSSNDCDALHLTGIIFYQQGKYDKAIEFIKKAINFCKNECIFHNNVALALQAIDNFDESIYHLKKSIELKPDYLEVHINLGNIYKKTNKYDQASYYYQKALEINPESLEVHNNLCVLYNDQNDYEKALKHGLYAINLNKDSANIYYNLGNVYRSINNFEEAVLNYQKAIKMKPDFADAHNNLAAIYKDKFNFDEAKFHFYKSLCIEENALSCYNLACVLQEQAYLNQAVDYYLKAIDLDSDMIRAHNNYLNCLNYMEEYDASYIFKEHNKWGDLQTGKIKSKRNYLNKFDENKKIKIGYVSSDFRNHPIGFFIESVLENHNKELFEIICYSNVEQPDNITERFKSYADKWIIINDLSNKELFNKIQSDQIDILIDLAGHTAGNKLMVFAQKPSPIQISYLGYPNTTGLKSIDYKITDSWVDPEYEENKFYTEKLIKLPTTFYCYKPPDEDFKIFELPALKNNYITFGVVQYFAKISNLSLYLWASILEKIPDSKLIIQTKALNSPVIKNKIQNIFKKHNVGQDRLILNGYSSFSDYMNLHNKIDIMLDTFPWNGHTTSCHSLWMGVPVLSLSGGRHASRLGKSLLSCLNMLDWIAENQNQYINIAIKKSQNLEKLSKLRYNLRKNMENSDLLDGKKFTNELEKIYKFVWEKLCKNEQERRKSTSHWRLVKKSL